MTFPFKRKGHLCILDNGRCFLELSIFYFPIFRNKNILLRTSARSKWLFILQFSSIKEQGTRIIIYNLWEDDEGHLELDFDEDIHVCSTTKY